MKLIQTIKGTRLELLAALNRKKPICPNKILFWSDLGHRYSCNPRYLSEHILTHYPGQFDVVWMFDQEAKLPDELPQGVRVVRYFSQQWLYEIATAKYIVCNHRIPGHFFFKKRPEQVYIQTWHSSLRLKTIEGDAAEALGAGYVQNAQADSRQIDYIISGCDFSSCIYKNSFWYDGKVLECGTPRIDYLLHQAGERKTLCRRAGLEPELHYVLYAPTFRAGDSLEAYNIQWERLTAVLEERFGGAWKVLYRLHPNLANRVSLDDLPTCCVNMTFYHDMQELLVLSDMLITDYSSSMFDVAYLGKPCILFATDLEDYVRRERKLYFDIKSLPFPLARTNEELEGVLRNFAPEAYRTEIEKFMAQIGSYETGAACETICHQILHV